MRILVTGASGYFAGELIKWIKENTDNEIIALTSDPYKPVQKGILVISNCALIDGTAGITDVDIVVHTAFCRKSNGKLLMESLSFMSNVAHWAINHNVKGFINLSSQSVYGSGSSYLPNEAGEINPGYLYALAKSASELLLEEIAAGKMPFTNIRLASLMGPSTSIPKNVLYKFIFSGLTDGKFCVIGGKQNFSFLDVRDAAEALGLFLNISPQSWDRAYNLGPESQTNILDMADIVCKKIFEVNGSKVEYELRPDDTYLSAGMNSEKLYKKLGWHPQYSFEMIVEDTIRFILGEG